jgi:hypothetical protein
MSTMSEQARAANKSKAERLVRADPTARVDASGYQPDGAMDADVVTGPRPISRRQFRRGGKVEGDASAPRADRKPRANGGALTANSLINRDVKDANKERGGITHVGGMKTGGRAHKMVGGALSPQQRIGLQQSPRPAMNPGARPMMRADGGKTSHGASCSCGKCSGGRVGRKEGGAINDGTRPVAGRMARKGGGRAKGKTNINIVIAPQGGTGQNPPMAPPGVAGAPPPGGPVGLHQGPPPPSPAAPPGAAPQPMMRKSGGRTLEKDGGKPVKPGAYPIESGAGGGLGRLEKAKAARP